MGRPPLRVVARVSARTDAGIKLWTPWPHIGRGAGDVCLGRVCISVYTEQTPMLNWHIRKARPQDGKKLKHLRFRAFSICVGPVMVSLRRWR